MISKDWEDDLISTCWICSEMVSYGSWLLFSRFIELCVDVKYSSWNKFSYYTTFSINPGYCLARIRWFGDIRRSMIPKFQENNLTYR